MHSIRQAHVKVQPVSSSRKDPKRVESTISIVSNIALLDDRTPERFPTIECLGNVFAWIIGAGFDVGSRFLTLGDFGVGNYNRFIKQRTSTARALPINRHGKGCR
jgi:hypothetical protein